MAQTRRLLCFVLVSLFCLAYSTHVIDAADIDGLSSKIDADLFLEDEGSGRGGIDDLEISGSGNGDDDEDTVVTLKPQPPKTTPKSSSVPDDSIGEAGGSPDIIFTPEGTNNNNNIFKGKEESPASFFSQPGILAAIICGAIVGLLCAILLVMFIVYRMRKKDEGSYVLDDSKRTTPSYGKSKEFFA